MNWEKYGSVVTNSAIESANEGARKRGVPEDLLSRESPSFSNLYPFNGKFVFLAAGNNQKIVAIGSLQAFRDSPLSDLRPSEDKNIAAMKFLIENQDVVVTIGDKHQMSHLVYILQEMHEMGENPLILWKMSPGWETPKLATVAEVLMIYFQR